MKNFFFLCAFFSLPIVAGCSKDSSDKDEDKPGNNNCKNEVVTRNDSIIITGCSDFEPSITFGTGGYLLSISEKTANTVGLEVYQTAFSSYMNVKSSSASSLREDGWYRQDGMWEKLEGTWKWRVKATGKYCIVFAKLPLAKTAASLPVTYNSAGLTVIGPFHAGSASTTFNISCPDAKLAGFTAELYDAVGQEVLANYTNILDVINLDDSHNQINNYSKTINLELPEGDYLIKVGANKDASWTVSIE